MLSAAVRHNVRESGRPDGRPIVFAHGFGCDQAMWRYVVPSFEHDHRVIAFDHAGSGHAHPEAYSAERYTSLAAYALDVLDICDELDLKDTILVGHSVSAMIGVLAVNRAPERFSGLVLVGPSPRYVDDDGYVGGFTREDIVGLLETMETDYLGWSSTMAPLIMGNGERPELGDELVTSFCSTDPEAAKQFARVTFLSDNRSDLAAVPVPSLILQCSDDIIAPAAVGTYVHEHIPNSRLVTLDATGHCPNLSAPDETAAAIRAFLGA
jgi:sigma-B regulation protein RsbQ